MTVFEFERLINRAGTNAIATDGFRRYLLDDDAGQLVLPCPDDEAIAMWVADMAFATPKVATDAMRKRIDHPIFGYTVPLDGQLASAFEGWCRRHYGWAPDAEHVLTAPGIVPALFDLVDFAIEPGEKVVTHTPAYEPFEMAIEHRGGELVTNRIVRSEDGVHGFDAAALERTLADPAVRLFILCHPHNPTGRAWNEDELRTMAEMAFANDVLIVSDEIHCDLLRRGRTHTPLAKLFPGSDQIITCMSSSKTFNLAGLGLAQVVIPNDGIREAWQERSFPVVNPLSEAAATAVFSEGDDWLEALKVHLDANFELVARVLAAELPDAVFRIPDATYLAWVDLSAYFEPGIDLTRHFAERAGVLIEGGDKFVADADGHIRVNLACPGSIVEQALERIVTATRG